MSEPTEVSALSVTEVVGRLTERRLDTQALTRAYLERIERVEPHVNAVLQIDPHAMALARTLDEERTLLVEPRFKRREVQHGLIEFHLSEIRIDGRIQS